MSEKTFPQRIGGHPQPFDMALAARTFDAMATAEADLPEALRAAVQDAMSPNSVFCQLLQGIAGNSPYLARLMVRSLPIVAQLNKNSPEKILTSRLDALYADMADAGDVENAKAILRRAKSDIALLIALADIGQVWPLHKVTAALSDFADVALQSGLRFLLCQAQQNGKLVLSSDKQPEVGSGIIIIGMGKYGACELNYSSDIDLIVFYESGRIKMREGIYEQDVLVRLAKDLVRLIQDDTRDGYVFRTDLRLRPDPASTNIAISIEAAEQYYESMGQNWERAAFIKARAAAGDVAAGETFLSHLSPFIWRKYLDFAAIEDIHSMKRQIHAFHGFGPITLPGANIKLGRGGIREVEFFCQTQQLIAGGRDPQLRVKTTCEGLDRLAEKEWIAASTAQDMKKAYAFLRTLEHRLQMINDEQTHSLPKQKAELERVACFMGFAAPAQLESELTRTLQTVQTHYGALFESAPPLSAESGSLVFTGSDDDPETLDTLAKLGFRNPSAAIATIRAWHVGRIRATRSARAKEMLTALMPDLLRALSRISDPDATLARFDRFLTGLPAGVQLFSLLYKNSGLLALLADILGTAPRLANFLSKQPSVLDAVLTPSFFERLPSHHERVANLSAALSRRRDFQDILDICRFWTREENFRIGAHVLTGLACAAEAGSAYADIAETVIANMQPAVEAELIKQHGVVPGGEIVVIGMGKLGGREMAANSDLDLIFVYDFPEKSLQSSGPRALASGQYFTRFSQRLINALTVPTAEGALYEVDMRLRPSGNSGPLATQFARFDDYHVTEAWTWEKMALLRARVISGPASLRGRVNAAICKSLSEERNERQTARDVVAMRERLEKQYPSADPWELKYVRGGLIDLEFTCQYLQLIHAAANPGILEANTCTAFDKMGAAGCIPVEEAKELANASDFLLTLMQILRLALDGPFVAKDATEALKGLLARAGGATSFGEVERRLEDVLSRVRLYFNQYVMGRAA